jgi:c-di-GMP-binding flagellar brake protein YcgR
LEERRAARRYKLTLQIEIRLEANRKEFEPILGRTRDISTHGFYFRSDQGLSVGMKFRFSIMPPWETAQATHAFISGRARAVRVDEVSESNVGRVGVGAMIERYKLRQTESSAYFLARHLENRTVMLFTVGERL